MVTLKKDMYQGLANKGYIMKTKEELELLKQEYESLNNKLKELSEDELKIVTGGFVVPKNNEQYERNLYENTVKPKDSF